MKRRENPLKQQLSDAVARSDKARKADAVAGKKPAAVLMAFVDNPQGDGCDVIFTRRSEDLPHHPGQICFPGGAAEGADQGVVETALRESTEEIGLLSQEVEIIGTLPKKLTVSGYAVTPVVGWLAQWPLLQANPAEVAEIFTVPFVALSDLAQYEKRVLEYNGALVESLFFQFGSYTIWGATAGMLFDFMKFFDYSNIPTDKP